MCRDSISGVRSSWSAVVLVLAGLAVGTASGDVPRLISYQGRLQGFGAGPVELEIKFYDSALAGTVLFAEVHAGVPLNAGVFSILIGSPTVGGLPDSAFVASEVWLGLTVDNGNEIAPRTRIVMVPFAAKAAAAERLVRPDSFETVALVDASGNLIIDSGLNVNGDIGCTALGWATSGLGPDQGGAIELGDDMGIGNSPYIDFHRGVGTAQDFNVRLQNDDDHRLSLIGDFSVRDSAGHVRMNLDANNGRLELIDAGGNIAARLSNPDGKLELFTPAPGPVETVEILAAGSEGEGARVELRRADGTTSVKLDADDSGAATLKLGNGADDRIELDGSGAGGGGSLTMRDSDGVDTTVLTNGDGGLLRLKEADGTNTVSLGAAEFIPFGEGAGGYLSLSNDSGNLVFRMSAEQRTFDLFDGSGGPGSEMRLITSPDGASVEFGAGTDPLVIAGHDNTVATRMWIAHSRAQPEWGIQFRDLVSDGLPANSIELVAGDQSAPRVAFELPDYELNMFNSLGNRTIELDSDISDTPALVLWRSDAVSAAITLSSEVNGPGGPAQIQLTRPGGGVGVLLSSEYGGAGGDSRIITDVLQINGGSDLSEQFEVTSAGTGPEPGMVVCIDPARSGELVVSTRAYDRTVAGILSGAGGVKPGMLMGQAGSLANGRHAVALTGRVYCQCDATNGSIQPGDLLTTSAVSGHAMKVTDHAAAQGAIIGKAMTSLESGQGLILVLVSLQ